MHVMKKKKEDCDDIFNQAFIRVHTGYYITKKLHDCEFHPPCDIISDNSSMKWRYIFIACIVLLGFFLKLHNYTVYPQRGATSDEYTYSFLGLSLLTKHIPISWSYFSAYKHREDLTIKVFIFPLCGHILIIRRSMD